MRTKLIVLQKLITIFVKHKEDSLSRQLKTELYFHQKDSSHKFESLNSL